MCWWLISSSQWLINVAQQKIYPVVLLWLISIFSLTMNSSKGGFFCDDPNFMVNICLFKNLRWCIYTHRPHNLYSGVIFFFLSHFLMESLPTRQSSYDFELVMIYQSHTQSWSVRATARGGLTCGLAWHSRKECYSPRKSYYSKVWWISVVGKLICGLTYNLL